MHKQLTRENASEFTVAEMSAIPAGSWCIPFITREGAKICLDVGADFPWVWVWDQTPCEGEWAVVERALLPVPT